MRCLPRCTLRQSAALAALGLALLGPLARAADRPQNWPKVTLADPQQVQWSGPLGEALQRGIARLAEPPYSEPWLLADVSFQVQRIFTNYSGDVSGRFLELASLTSPAGRHAPPTLDPVRAAVGRFQKPDGHFGVDIDLSKPLIKNSPPIPMLWGNGRLLVGLTTAARVFHDPQLLASARRLGDFYVNTADQLCSPAREAEYHASGTYGEGYCCCYFPAIEGLAMLYRDTRDDRYLKMARRMAEFFRKFDALPIDHSHGNLCAWRGILELYEITGDRGYLDRARAKWDAAVAGGYVWPIGGIGEHWYVNFGIDEGCSESDWLRFCLDLWRYTGKGRCLDVAERLLHNQYLANQCPNGGYGARHFEGQAGGPVATLGTVDEWNFCCNFHGPLGLFFTKSYLATGSDKGVMVNFPEDFSAPVQAGGRTWQVTVRSKPQYVKGNVELEIELAPIGANGPVHTTLLVRVPDWATVDKRGQNDLINSSDPFYGYVAVEGEFKAGEPVRVVFRHLLVAEGPRFQVRKPEPGKISRLPEVTLVAGPEVLYAATAGISGRPTLLATIDEHGQMALPSEGVTVLLPRIEATRHEIACALESGRPVVLQPWPQKPSPRRQTFVYDLVVLPAQELPAARLESFAKRAKDAAAGRVGPIFGEDLEKKPGVWLPANDWKFTPDGLLVHGGEIGLLDGEGYGDYRFDFDLVLPKDGEGISGWLVRAGSESDCLMFQLQSADSPFVAPQFKTRPNTLRPHTRRNGQWTVLDPVTLPKEVRRGEPHHVTVECRGEEIAVALDGQSIYRQKIPGWSGGTVGFRASGPAEQGLFRHIRLERL
jgi:hypothetical protein